MRKFSISSFPSHITQKLYVVYELSAHQMTAPLSEVFLSGPKLHASYMSTQKLQATVYKDVLHVHIERLLYYQRCLICGLESYTRFY